MELFKHSLPGSIPFLLIAFGAGLGLLSRARTRSYGEALLAGLLLGYVFFSVPVLSRLLAMPLEWGFDQLRTKAEISGSRAIVVLDGGTFRYGDGDRLVEFPNRASTLRALEAARLYRLLGGGVLVVVTGGAENAKANWGPEASTMRDVLVKVGVPPSTIVLDSGSLNTREHAVNVVRLLRERGISKFALVTSPTHIRRAVMAFKAVQADPIPSPSRSTLEYGSGWEGCWPSGEALLYTQEVMHDYLGLAYYRVRNWL